MSVAVVGAGVIGLSSALQLLRAGFDVTVIADAWSPETTSDGAGALWERHDADPRHAAWARETYLHYCALITAGTAASAGVGLIEGDQFSEKREGFGFKEDVLRFRRATAAELAAASARTGGAFVDGCVWTSVIADPPAYLAWLLQGVRDAGGRCERRHVRDLRELAGAFSLAVNCTGLGATGLVRDPACTPVRGQVLRVRAPHVTRFATASTGAYVLPRPTSGVITCGGTYQAGRSSTTVDPEDSRAIWDGCCALVPELADPRTVVLGEWVGLRPGRVGGVRLELEWWVPPELPVPLPAAGTAAGASASAPASGGLLPTPSAETAARALPVVHCYGHGGCGHSLHWGCARDVVRLAIAALRGGDGRSLGGQQTVGAGGRGTAAEVPASSAAEPRL